MDMQRETYAPTAMARADAGEDHLYGVVDCALGLIDDTGVCRDWDDLIAAFGGGNCWVETGTYTGDGGISQVISLDDSDLVVKYVRIGRRETVSGTNIYTEETSDVIVDDNAAGYNWRGDNTAAGAHIGRPNGIIALGTGSFTVDDAGGDLDPNKSGATYNYWVIGVH